MKMRDLLSIERIIPRLKARSKLKALRTLARQAADQAEASESVVLASMMEYAQLPALGPGSGASLVHAFVPELRNPVAIFARLEPAIDFGAADSSPTDLVMLLVSSTGSSGDHLRALACIARTLRDPGVRHLLRAATDREALYVILCGKEREGHASPQRRAAART